MYKPSDIQRWQAAVLARIELTQLSDTQLIMFLGLNAYGKNEIKNIVRSVVDPLIEKGQLCARIDGPAGSVRRVVTVYQKPQSAPRPCRDPEAGMVRKYMWPDGSVQLMPHPKQVAAIVHGALRRYHQKSLSHRKVEITRDQVMQAIGLAEELLTPQLKREIDGFLENPRAAVA